VAYHLAKAGCTDVVLVDKGELTSGTTFHSVGLVSQFRTSPALMKIVNYTITPLQRARPGRRRGVTRLAHGRQHAARLEPGPL